MMAWVFEKLGGKVLLIAIGLVSGLIITQPASALTPLPIPDPKPGGFGLEATKTQPPPTQGATITTPGNGASFANSPITVTGLCPNELLVQVYNNNVMVGAVVCQNGSFSLEISLFSGTNELKALVYDDLEQAGPESNIVTVTYTDTRFSAFGELVTLTSAYGRRSAPAGSQLTWPLQLSGGTGPYAFVIDWGDGSKEQLLSQPLEGVVNIAYPYKRAGVYRINIRVADVNGVSAFLQVIAVSSGEVEQSTDDQVSQPTEKTTIIWVPAVVAMILLIPSYWLGRRSQLVSLRHKMSKERDSYQQK